MPCGPSCCCGGVAEELWRDRFQRLLQLVRDAATGRLLRKRPRDTFFLALAQLYAHEVCAAFPTLIARLTTSVIELRIYEITR